MPDPELRDSIIPFDAILWMLDVFCCLCEVSGRIDSQYTALLVVAVATSESCRSQLTLGRLSDLSPRCSTYCPVICPSGHLWNMPSFTKPR